MVATLLPSKNITKVNIWEYDKIGHFLMFMVWTFLYGVVRALRQKSAPNLIIVFSLGLFYGLLIEVLQLVLPTNRSPELYDFIADALGSGFAILLLKYFFQYIFKDDNTNLHDNAIT